MEHLSVRRSHWLFDLREWEPSGWIGISLQNRDVKMKDGTRGIIGNGVGLGMVESDSK